jgi:hypothetical protein
MLTRKQPASFKPRRKISQSATIPAPVGGLNTYNSIAQMPAEDAISMTNFFPESFGVSLRRGYREHATGFDGIVGTIMPWNSQGGTSKLFAVDEVGIYDVTTAAVVGAPVRASAFNEWQYTNFGNPAGTHLIAFNGVDTGFWYSNAGVQALTAGDGIANGTWNGVNPVDLIHVCVHQHRVWAVEKDTTLGWYLPPEQVFGVAASFDFGPNFTKGGYLQQLIPWTVDTGVGSDDYLLALSSAGEIQVWKGTDPASVASWALVGTYYVGNTFSRRAASKVGGDVMFLTQFGLLAMSAFLSTEALTTSFSTISTKIQTLISEVVTAGATRDGWQIVTHPAANFLMINVPGVDVSQNFQFVFNLVTKAWTTFGGMLAHCWLSEAGELFFGADGIMYQAWDGNIDNILLDGSGGQEISGECQQAFTFFGSPGVNKHFKFIRPIILNVEGFAYTIGANMNFDLSGVSAPGSVSPSPVGLWNIGLWNAALWAGSLQTAKDWSSVVGIGYAASVRMRLNSVGEVIWASTDWVFEPGGII